MKREGGSEKGERGSEEGERGSEEGERGSEERKEEVKMISHIGSKYVWSQSLDSCGTHFYVCLQKPNPVSVVL